MSLRHKAGFLAATTLLSGSAFAFAPEFRQDLPTVIITDKLPVAEQSGSGIYDVNGAPAAATQYVVRGSAMLDTRDYFSAAGQSDEAGLQGNAFADVKFRFTESLFDDTNGIGALSNDATLKINDEVSNGGIPDVADFAGASLLNGRYTAADGLLDFRNADASGTNDNVNSGFSGIGSVTGQDFTASAVQKRWVDIYLNAGNDKISNKGFLVISSVAAADEDGLGSSVGSSDPFTEVDTFDTFAGWISVGVSYPTVGDFVGGTNVSTAGYTFTPATSPATAAAGSIGVTTNSGAIVGLARWTSVGAFAATKNTLYRMRANLTSNASSNGIIRFTIGSNNADNYLGFGTIAYNDIAGKTSPAEIGAGGEMVAYLLARDTGSADVVLEIVPLGASGGQDFTVDSVQIDSADPNAIGTPNVVLNLGGAVTAATDAYTTAPSGQAGFATGAGSTTNVVFGASGMTVASSITSSAVTTGFSNNNDGFAVLNFEDTDGLDATVPGTFEAEVGKMYLMDVWMSSTTPAAARFPEFNPSIVGGANNVGWSTFQLDAVPTGGGTNGNPIETASSPYTVAWAPQDASGGATTLQAVPSLRFLSYDRTYTGTANITINRIVVSEYEGFLD